MNFIFEKILLSTPTNNLAQVLLLPLRFISIFIIPILFLGSCSQSAEKGQNLSSNKSIQYLALGDSYTIGESVSEPECWPNQLADSLRINEHSILE